MTGCGSEKGDHSRRGVQGGGSICAFEALPAPQLAQVLRMIRWAMRSRNIDRDQITHVKEFQVLFCG
jgi:hypothetical protein